MDQEWRLRAPNKVFLRAAKTMSSGLGSSNAYDFEEFELKVTSMPLTCHPKDPGSRREAKGDGWALSGDEK